MRMSIEQKIYAIDSRSVIGVPPSTYANPPKRWLPISVTSSIKGEEPPRRSAVGQEAEDGWIGVWVNGAPLSNVLIGAG